ncbi:MAG: adenylate/guanylate cyclase domain-containing protein [Gammaproteobacteria bacterium]|nr:adenylate/guanylate cyclase domain-containing protein [Gammaproteobacteria bacterium]
MLVEKIRRQGIRIALSLSVLAFFLIDLVWIDLPFIDQMENLAYDARVVVTTKSEPDDRIVIVDIDERSLTAEGRWPWPRDKIASLVEQLFEKYQVAVVAFDVVFAEADDSSGLLVLDRLAKGELAAVKPFQDKLAELRTSLDYDRIFAETIGRYPVVLGYYFNPPRPDGEAEKIGALPPPTLIAGTFAGRKVAFRQAAGYGANLDILQKNAAAAGHFLPSTDGDGIVRRVPLLYEYDGAYYEALSLAVARVALHIDQVTPRFAPVPWGAKRDYSGLEWLAIGNRSIPVDERVQTLIPYRGGQGSFPYVAATDVLHGTVDPGMLDGRIVLVGTTAPGLLDLRSTPVQNVYPGVEIHANLIAGIIDGKMKEKPAYTLGAEFIILTIVGLILALVLPFQSPLMATVVTVVVLIGSIAINQAVWSYGNLVLPIASGVMMIGLMFLLNMSYGYFIETRGKRQLTSLFGQYVPPELVDEMSRDPEAYSLEADSRELTVLFSDVRGFTTISEGLNPKELAELMNHFLTPMTHVIHENRGTIDKYMGDAIMAFWGAPLEDPDHARHALESGMQMLARIDEINTEFAKRSWPEIHIGVGINTGAMSVGNMGSEFRMAYTVMGDAVNLGSRLEGLTKTYGVSIIVSETTRAAVPDYAYRELDRVRVKGKDEPVAIFEPLGPAGAVSKPLADELKLYRQALKYYRSQQWDMAELQFLNLGKSSASPALYDMYVGRISHFREHPPGEDWDGVFTHKTK